MITLSIPREVKSHNALYHAHFRTVAKERKAWETAVHWAALVAKVERSELPRRCSVRILARRKRLIRDSANLVGGCKQLMDALVSLRLIYDDADKWCTIHYAQELCRGQPVETLVWIEDDDAREDQIASRACEADSIAAAYESAARGRG